MRKIAQFGKYILSLAIPPWTSFTVLLSHLRPTPQPGRAGDHHPHIPHEQGDLLQSWSQNSKPHYNQRPASQFAPVLSPRSITEAVFELILIQHWGGGGATLGQNS
jgi:hypothetical protein